MKEFQMVESDVPPTDKISCDIVGTQESILLTAASPPLRCVVDGKDVVTIIFDGLVALLILLFPQYQ
ncbi:hypothetical protein GBA52_003653 [Prunus armeniaca]|nr:hypothetical protein GBA52_003653 [Prunus armeniaca]